MTIVVIFTIGRFALAVQELWRQCHITSLQTWIKFFQARCYMNEHDIPMSKKILKIHQGKNKLPQICIVFFLPQKRVPCSPWRYAIPMRQFLQSSKSIKAWLPSEAFWQAVMPALRVLMSKPYLNKNHRVFFGTGSKRNPPRVNDAKKSSKEAGLVATVHIYKCSMYIYIHLYVLRICLFHSKHQGWLYRKNK